MSKKSRCLCRLVPYSFIGSASLRLALVFLLSLYWLVLKLSLIANVKRVRCFLSPILSYHCKQRLWLSTLPDAACWGAPQTPVHHRSSFCSCAFCKRFMLLLSFKSWPLSNGPFPEISDAPSKSCTPYGGSGGKRHIARQTTPPSRRCKYLYRPFPPV